MEKILIAVDDSPISEIVASKGYELAKKLKAEIALVSVVDTTFLTTDGSITPREMVNSIKIDFKKSQQMLIETIFQGKEIATFVEEGKPYESILKIADEWQANLIVMGTHGRTGLSHLLMGSVAEKTIRHSAKPIFIIPAEEKH